MVLFKKENIDADKPVPVGNIPPVRFISAPTRQGITCTIQVDWDPEILVAVISMVGVPVEESLFGIRMKARHVMIHMGCDGESSWVMSLGEV